MLNKDICIVIPCYNEGPELKVQKYLDFLSNENKCLLCFVNDGSTDNTLSILKEVQQKYEQQIIVLSSSNNVGKAEAVRKGFLFCNNDFNFKYIAYLDADLSTSLQECIKLSSHLNENIEFVYGSRLKKKDTNINRKIHRFIAGRIIATIISKMLGLNIYDTQCGCKIFSKNLSQKIFELSFISRWLFDVEIFFRMIKLYGRDKVFEKMKEVPLNEWIDRGNTKIKVSYIFKIWIDLFLIYKEYRKLKPSYHLNLKKEKKNVS